MLPAIPQPTPGGISEKVPAPLVARANSGHRPKTARFRGTIRAMADESEKRDQEPDLELPSLFGFGRKKKGRQDQRASEATAEPSVETSTDPAGEPLAADPVAEAPTEIAPVAGSAKRVPPVPPPSSSAPEATQPVVGPPSATEPAPERAGPTEPVPVSAVSSDHSDRTTAGRIRLPSPPTPECPEWRSRQRLPSGRFQRPRTRRCYPQLPSRATPGPLSTTPT